ncbi:probable low affinity copper uptake protein 2 [Moschus berezovskii]|uniref:probable low affinity copper uptake protein 2 n=1 Tax=Moschus berezovskii TaxID=68408 RepID=UPI002443F053|nr:probable low affinity copper uptake protein 2 [Moschus berezovskii]
MIIERQVKCKTGRGPKGRQKGPRCAGGSGPEAGSAPFLELCRGSGRWVRPRMRGALWGPQVPGARARASPGPRDRAAPVAIAEAVRARSPSPESRRGPGSRPPSALTMAMHFIFSDEVVLLFDFWSVHSPTGMALSVLVILLLAVLYESIKVGKARLLHQALMNLSIPTSQQLIEEADQDSSSSDTLPVSRSPLRWFLCHFGQSLLHVAQVVVGYFMMLAVMSYNTWIFFGVVLGSGVGYYLAYPLLSMT